MIIKTDTTISNLCSEKITVLENCTLTIDGICSQSILANSNSKIIVNGICNKLETSKDSYAKITGTVNHFINNGNSTITGIVTNLEDLSENTIIKTGAFVNNKKY